MAGGLASPGSTVRRLTSVRGFYYDVLESCGVRWNEGFFPTRIRTAFRNPSLPIFFSPSPLTLSLSLSLSLYIYIYIYISLPLSLSFYISLESSSTVTSIYTRRFSRPPRRETETRVTHVDAYYIQKMIHTRIHTVYLRKKFNGSRKERTEKSGARENDRPGVRSCADGRGGFLRRRDK